MALTTSTMQLPDDISYGILRLVDEQKTTMTSDHILSFPMALSTRQQVDRLTRRSQHLPYFVLPNPVLWWYAISIRSAVPELTCARSEASLSLFDYCPCLPSKLGIYHWVVETSKLALQDELFLWSRKCHIPGFCWQCGNASLVSRQRWYRCSSRQPRHPSNGCSDPFVGCLARVSVCNRFSSHSTFK